MSDFSSHCAVTDDTAVLHLTGDIDVSAAEAMAMAGQRLLHDPDVRTLVVDCSAVRFCDSTALGILVSWHQDASLQDKSMLVRSMPEGMHKIVRLTGLNKVLAIQP